jgi:AcrR family transcriptional regulator
MHPDSKKARILRATLRLITEKGFHGTPVSLIARVADVGAGTIYRYFANKEALINELYDHLQQQLHEATLQAIPEGVSVRDEFYLKWKNILTYFLDNPDEARFLEQYSASPFISPEVVAENNKRNIHLQTLRRRGIDSGELRPVAYSTLVVFMWGTVLQLSRQKEAGALTITEPVLQEIFSVFWEGVKVRASDPETTPSGPNQA